MYHKIFVSYMNVCFQLGSLNAQVLLIWLIYPPNLNAPIFKASHEFEPNLLQQIGILPKHSWDIVEAAFRGKAELKKLEKY